MKFNRFRKLEAAILILALAAGIFCPGDMDCISAKTAADNMEIGQLKIGQFIEPRAGVSGWSVLQNTAQDRTTWEQNDAIESQGGAVSSSSAAISASATPSSSVTPAPTTTPESTVTPAPTTTPESTVTPAPTTSPSSTVTPVPTAEPGVTPAVTASPKPTATPNTKKYTLYSPKARYKKGKLEGIHYHQVKSKKVYRLTSYVTDEISLKMSQSSKFEIYGAGSKKQIKKKYVTVNSKGVVKCHHRDRGEEVYVLIRATSKTTKKVQYIYIRFKKKLSCDNRRTIKIYEKYSEQLKFDYAKSKLKFTVSNKKACKVNKKGKLTALKKGKATVTIRVRDSKKNQVQIKVLVTKEPWIVSDKDTVYDYEDMTKDLKSLKSKYGGKVELKSLGTSYDKRTIWCLRIGRESAPHRLIIDSSIHAREWLNTQILMRQTEDLLRSYRDYRERFQNACLYIVPMDNPDGVSISQYGFSAIRNEKLRKICKKAGHSDIWKANARGVNLNNNFPAGFTKTEVRKPDFMAYNGKKAASEKETRILMKLVNSVNPDAVINLHSTGSILYWDFDVEGQLYEDIHELALKINSFNHYPLMSKSGSTSANGGMADWIVYKKKKVSVTIETGVSACPLPHSEYKSIYKKNHDMFLWFMSEY